MSQDRGSATGPAASNSNAAQVGDNRHDLQISPFISTTDPDENALQWTRWLKHFCRKLRFFRVSNVQDKVDAFYIYGGAEIENLLDTLPNPTATEVQVPDFVKPTGEETNEFHILVHKVNKHYSTMVNKDSARSKFESMAQNDQSMAQYYVSLKQQADKCQFPDIEDAIRSKILQSMTDKHLRREAMMNGSSLSKILKDAANREDVERQAQEMERMSIKEEVNQVYAKRKPPYRGRKKPGSESHKTSSDGEKCGYCGTSHERSRNVCPASGKRCKKCKRQGHFAIMCRSSDKKKPHTQTRYIGNPEESDSDSDMIFSITSPSKMRPTVKISVNGVKGCADADSGSTVNVMDREQYRKIEQNSKFEMPLKPADNTLFAYAQSKPITLAGKFTANIRSIATGMVVQTEFLVVEGTANSRPLLGYETAVKLGVMHVTNKMEARNPITKEDIIQEYPTVFQGIGLHRNIKAKLIVDETITPVAQKARKIPYNLRKQAEQEEKRLLEADIIEHVPDTVPTTWCTNPVVVPKPNKPGQIRYCSNMRVPNIAIKRPITEALTVEDIKVRMSGSKVFSILDMNEAYHQLELAEESRHMTTFYGTQGRLRYKRLNFGTISAQDIFDKAVDDTIQGLTGVVHIRDDFVVFGPTQEAHDNNLRKFLTRMKDVGLTLSSKKCKISVPSVEFFGVVFSEKGTSPAASRVEALQNMSEPKDVSEVRSLLGMAQYSASYIPNFSSITAPLRELTKSTSKWKWSETEQNAFTTLKNSLSCDSVLGYYETNQETKLMVDAGPKGIGLLLAQRKPHGWQAVACYSRSLTEAEQKYSQLEREALAIRWGCERCYNYLIGSKFVVVTDHKPLLSMFTNPHSKPPLRIEKWLMYLQQFDFKLVYEPGKNNTADYVSRHALPINEKAQNRSKRHEERVNAIVSNTIPKAVKVEEVQKETKKDKSLSQLIPMILSGRIRAVKKNPDTRMFYKVFQELSYVQGMVMRGNQIVIPQALQSRVLNICHEAHLGIVKSKQ